jgi:hypothetical protein
MSKSMSKSEIWKRGRIAAGSWGVEAEFDWELGEDEELWEQGLLDGRTSDSD